MKMTDKWSLTHLNPWMTLYLKFLALIFAYGGAVHLGNILGWGEQPWQETPLTWRVGDLVYGILDCCTVVGLWQGKRWGILCFLIAIASQFLIYTIFIDHFAVTPAQRGTIYSLLGIEGSLLLIFCLLLWLKK